MRIAVGVDVHSEMCTARAAYAGTGKTDERDERFLESFNREFSEFPSTPPGFKKIVEFLGKNEYEILIENSGKSHDAYWILTNMECRVTVAFSADLYRITKSVTKTDKKDAVHLAGYMRRRMNGEDEFATCYMPSPEWMIKRELCRAYLANGEHLSDVKKRLRAHLPVHGLDLGRDHSDITGPKAVACMRRFNDPYIAVLCSDAKTTKERRAMTERTIMHMFKDDGNFDLVYSIPGFGVVSSAYISALVVDVDRFTGREQFCAYFGVVPRKHASADHDPDLPTTHRGDDDMRKLLMMCTLVHVRNTEDSVVTKLYRRLLANGKPQKEALVAASRKMLVVIFAVMRSGKKYSEDPVLLKKAREDAEEEK